jgi:hypothetical protein
MYRMFESIADRLGGSFLRNSNNFQSDSSYYREWYIFAENQYP